MTKISEKARKEMFTRGRNLDTRLGDIFQNEMPMTQAMIDAELDQIDERFNELLQYYKNVKTLEILL